MTDRKTITAQVAADRLDDQLQELAEVVSDGRSPDANPAEVEARRNGARYVAREYGSDAEVVIEALRTGAFGLVEDYAADAAREKMQSGGGAASNGLTRPFYVARGCVDAPFYDDGVQDYEDRVATVRGLPVEVSKWLEFEIGEHTDVDAGNSKSFADYLAETSTETEASSGESGGTPPE
ncbi:hypothetical protein [Haloarchaeobius sp. HRN-SO-5]|uniref:hypothetical protein n=1 Tax=Haloarchaeobius sp. HRN-SO-5 TaxID=3446118 RepID=UPI003EB7DB0D